MQCELKCQPQINVGMAEFIRNVIPLNVVIKAGFKALVKILNKWVTCPHAHAAPPIVI